MLARLAKWSDGYLYAFLLAIVLIMPIHAFIVISLGHILGHQNVWQGWKEAGLLAGTIAAAIVLIDDRRKLRQLTRQPVAWLVGLMIIYALSISAYYRTVDLYHTALGFKTSLAFLVIFIVMQVANFTPKRWNTILKALLIISSAVGLFAVLQVYLLPNDFLARFGYGSASVAPFHLVDPALNTVRIIATLSGPNQLGSFMIIPLVLSFWLVLHKKWLASVPLALSSFALWHSYSRSAWIGAVIGLITVLGIYLKGWWRLSLLALIALVIIGGLYIRSTTSGRTGDLRYYVYHGEIVDGKANGSDQQRLQSAQRGLRKIQDRPQGYGLGTAGPASQGTDQPIITENSYLQIGIETGVPGLTLFIAIVVLTIAALWQRMPIISEAGALISILLGLSVTNLFLHTWSDSATALIFWALAGFVLAQPTIRRST